MTKDNIAQTDGAENALRRFCSRLSASPARDRDGMVRTRAMINDVNDLRKELGREFTAKETKRIFNAGGLVPLIPWQRPKFPGGYKLKWLAEYEAKANQ